MNLASTDKVVAVYGMATRLFILHKLNIIMQNTFRKYRVLLHPLPNGCFSRVPE